jgi:hypothetical protein
MADPIIVERRGVDLAPIDPATTDGRLMLTAFVWPDDQPRHERLRAALRTADRLPATVERGDLRALLRSLTPHEGVVTVVWHSVALMYLERAVRADAEALIAGLLAQARPSAPVVRIGFEPVDRVSHTFPVRMAVSPGHHGAMDDDVIGNAPPHGVPVQWGTAGPVSEPADALR